MSSQKRSETTLGWRRSSGGFTVACILAFIASPLYGQVPLVTIQEECLGNVAIGGICETIPGFLENPAQQGIASAGSRFFTSRGVCWGDPVLLTPSLYEYSSSWNRVRDEPIDFAGSLCHVGDIAVRDGYIYAPMSDAQEAGGTTFHIARFNTSDLSYDTHWDVTGILAPYGIRDLAGIGFDAQGNLHAVEFQNGGEDFPHIFWIDLQDTPEVIMAQTISTHYANGIEFSNGDIWITWGTSPTVANIDVYTGPVFSGPHVQPPLASYTYDISGHSVPQGAHAEGLTLAVDDLWVCAGGGDLVRRIEAPAELDSVPTLQTGGMVVFVLALVGCGVWVIGRRRTVGASG